MSHLEAISDQDVKEFLGSGVLAARMAIEMGIDKDPTRIRQLVATYREWNEESAQFNSAVDESLRTQYHPRTEFS